jgi:hypothetical protein
MIRHGFASSGTSKGKSEPVKQEEGSRREGDAEYRSGGSSEKMLEYDEDGSAQA